MSKRQARFRRLSETKISSDKYSRARYSRASSLDDKSLDLTAFPFRPPHDIMAQRFQLFRRTNYARSIRWTEKTWRDFYVSGQDNIFRYYIITWLDGNENYVFIARTLFLSYHIPDTRRALSNRGQPKIYFNDHVPNLWSIACRISICHRVIDFYRRFNLHLLASATGEQIRKRDFSWIAIKRSVQHLFRTRERWPTKHVTLRLL